MFRNILVVLSLLFITPSALAAECSVELEGNDAMQFNLDTIEVSKGCATFTINLSHVGALARNVMGHNVVITATENRDAVNMDGLRAGLENNYVKPGDERVIAHAKVIGGGESTSVSFDPSKLSESKSWSFFCSFPGHASMMNGKIKLVP